MKTPHEKPASLFRYQSLANRDYLKPVLLDSKLHTDFLGKGGFNDPCEAFYSMNISWNEKAVRENIRQLKANAPLIGSRPYGKDARREAGVITPEEEAAAFQALVTKSEDELVEHMRKAFLGGQLPPDIERSLKESQERLDKTTIGLCCFTEVNNSPYMSWNYAGKSSGVCLEFDTSIAPISLAVPVNYAEHPPILDINASPYEMQVARMQTKGLEWSGECEWRLIGDPDIGENILFPPEALRSLCFCTGVNEEDTTYVVSWLRQREKRLPVFRFAVDRSSYSYKRVPLDIY
jgi:hypothetical protein